MLINFTIVLLSTMEYNQTRNFAQFDYYLDLFSLINNIPASILRKSTSGRHRPVRVADGPMTARYRFT